MASCVKNPFYLTFFACATLALGGCETVDNGWASLKDSISSIEMPSITAKEPAPATGDEPRTATVATAVTPVEKEDLSADEFRQLAAAPRETAYPQNTGLVSYAEDGLSPENDSCPPVAVVEELGMLHQFIDMSMPNATNSISRIKMTDVKSHCAVNQNNIIVDMTIRFEGTLGAAAGGWNTERPSFAYPYFLAITDGRGSIVAKEVFGVSVTYERGQTDLVREENLRQIIPLHGAVGESHELLLGFQLTEAELAYNRAMLAAKRGGTSAQVTLPAVTLEKPQPAAQAPVKITPPKPGEKPPAPAPEPAAAPQPAPAAQPQQPSTAAPAPQPAAPPAGNAGDAPIPALIDNAPAAQPAPAGDNAETQTPQDMDGTGEHPPELDDAPAPPAMPEGAGNDITAPF